VKPATQDLEIYKGDTVEVFFRVRGKESDGSPGPYVDLTGSTAKSQIRATAASPTPLAEFTCTLSNQATTPGGVLLTLTPVQTQDIAETQGVWDVQITNAAGEVRTYLAGKVTFVNEVTRV